MRRTSNPLFSCSYCTVRTRWLCHAAAHGCIIGNCALHTQHEGILPESARMLALKDWWRNNERDNPFWKRVSPISPPVYLLTTCAEGSGIRPKHPCDGSQGGEGSGRSESMRRPGCLCRVPAPKRVGERSHLLCGAEAACSELQRLAEYR